VYFAYREWLALKRNEHVSCLNWIAGVASICGLIYYIMENSSLSTILIKIVTDQSVMVLNFLTSSNFISGGLNSYGVIVTNINGSYVVTIIFACTAVQAMVLFVGFILALESIGVRKKSIGLLITIVPIYILNLLRNGMVIFLIGNKITSFDIAHNVLSKTGALITLIVLLFVVFKIIPELYDEIICLINLPKKKGPVENFFAGFMRKKQNESR
jgi:archaeosortase A (PGF-CTERM-specific)